MADKKAKSGKVGGSVFKRAVKNIQIPSKPKTVPKTPKKKDFIKLEAAQQTQKLEKSFKNEPSIKGRHKKGIIYLSHVPPGFYEKEMKRYFSQFGTVTRVNLAKSSKTGKSKGYAYIEFRYEEVAKIVAETMNNYLMCNRLLKAEFVQGKKIARDEKFWKNINERTCPGVVNKRKEVKKFNSRMHNPEQHQKFIEKQQSKLQELCEKLKSRGINFSFEPEYAEIDTKISGEGKYTQLKESEQSDGEDDLAPEGDENDSDIEFNPTPTVKRKSLAKDSVDHLPPKKKKRKSRYFNELVPDIASSSAANDVEGNEVKVKKVFQKGKKKIVKPIKKSLRSVASLPGVNEVLKGKKKVAKKGINKKDTPLKDSQEQITSSAGVSSVTSKKKTLKGRKESEKNQKKQVNPVKKEINQKVGMQSAYQEETNGLLSDNDSEISFTLESEVNEAISKSSTRQKIIKSADQVKGMAKKGAKLVKRGVVKSQSALPNTRSLRKKVDTLGKASKDSKKKKAGFIVKTRPVKTAVKKGVAKGSRSTMV